MPTAARFSRIRSLPDLLRNCIIPLNIPDFAVFFFGFVPFSFRPVFFSQLAPSAYFPLLFFCFLGILEKEVLMSVVIINNRIDGLRVTIFDVLHYLEAGRLVADIATILPLTQEQLEAAIRYIGAHRDEVMAAHQRIQERIARGNPPELEAHAQVGRARMEALRRAIANEVNGEGVVGRRE
jgi:uncharacterized protein (DUF433 family)